MKDEQAEVHIQSLQYFHAADINKEFQRTIHLSTL